MNDTVSSTKPSSKNVSASSTAVQHFKKCLHSNNAKALRMRLKKSGCSGLAYELAYVDTPIDTDIQVSLAEDCIIYIEKGAYPFIKGTHIDYIKEGLNFKLVYQNPNQTGECGCGESFTVDEVPS
jgi:iron-sulfur cluster assembly protein